MEIEQFADFDIVKKRYRELALLYHPDRNPNNKHAEEFFKILTQGYNILSEPEHKVEYDNALKNYYFFKQTAQTAKPDRNEEIRSRIRRRNEQKKEEFIRNYVKDENVFPHRYRLILAILYFASGVLMSYNNWFLNFLNYNIFYIVVGSFLFALGAYKISENLYNRRGFKKAMQIEEDEGKRLGPVGLFLILFFITPILFLGAMDLTRTIHMKYFYNTTVVDKVTVTQSSVSYTYTVNGEKIMRRSDLGILVDYSDYSNLRVKYSRINPNISELIVLDKTKSIFYVPELELYYEK